MHLAKGDRNQNRLLERVYYFLLAALIFIALFFASYLSVLPDGEVLKSGWQVSGEVEGESVSLPHIIQVEGISHLSYTKTLNIPPDNALVVANPLAHAMDVFVNGEHVFAMGDEEAPTANIWNRAFLVHLPEGNGHARQLEIRLHTPNNKIGLGIPPYIIPFDQAQMKVAWSNFFSDDILLLSMGASLVTGIFLISISLIGKKELSSELFIGLAAICASIYCLEYHYRISTGSIQNFLLVRKLLISNGFLGASFYVLSLEKYYRGRIRYGWLLGIPTLISILVLAVQPTPGRLAESLLILLIVLLINLTAAVILILSGRRGRDWLAIPAVVLSLSLLEIIISMVFGLNWPDLLQYSVLISTIVFGANMIVEFRSDYGEKLQLEQKTNKDPLTGVFNRNILEEIQLERYDVLVFMDLDNFKEYNDQYGHQQGDEVLKKFAGILGQNLRKNDIIIRYGGDEFLLLLQEINKNNAEIVAERIRQDLNLSVEDELLDVSYGLGEVDHTLESVIEKADKMMYEMKRD